MAGLDLSVGDYALLTRRFKDVARMCGHDRVVVWGYGKWGNVAKKSFWIDLYWQGVNSHVHELVGIKQVRQGRGSKKKRN